ncbi:hypothetical protein JYJ95_38160 [Corallococcus exiguus]|uniref:hypothetical protein n=1 Tax=Corallococcus exiguus TaxID=83462 RepID=UPI001A90740C|nr:hypothetical protein [Corallococcus exiguus]MBN8472363.1 hypothetical protein [Corallococcus exiguus]
MSAPSTHSAAVIRVALRSGTGHRVSISDPTGVVVSVWDANARKAWAKADELERVRRERERESAALASGTCTPAVTRRPTR